MVTNQYIYIKYEKSKQPALPAWCQRWSGSWPVPCSRIRAPVCSFPNAPPPTTSARSTCTTCFSPYMAKYYICRYLCIHMHMLAPWSYIGGYRMSRSRAVQGGSVAAQCRKLLDILYPNTVFKQEADGVVSPMKELAQGPGSAAAPQQPKTTLNPKP